MPDLCSNCGTHRPCYCGKLEGPPPKEHTDAEALRFAAEWLSRDTLDSDYDLSVMVVEEQLRAEAERLENK